MNMDNWTHCFYKTQKLKAFISLGGIPRNQDTLLYFVTVTDFSNKEVFQKPFEELNDAVFFIKNRYGHWEFEDMNKKSEGGGCGSCAAH